MAPATINVRYKQGACLKSPEACGIWAFWNLSAQRKPVYRFVGLLIYLHIPIAIWESYSSKGALYPVLIKSTANEILLDLVQLQARYSVCLPETSLGAQDGATPFST